ncbi:uncharacterized protein BJ171DRAFT_216666 [Polychytrium aggregatum]|uniref:uncharacterized protein n=1 Tax=Polychytrium aggregatum TaxID=110093 RepID=UPI0022FECB98|nr:uncharacterized protein BJ171DRAFT_216666 [Polychytrium aggregatum]KAI9199365.1 hypothetical protein BJ171DRAFT_216666 [Polychytrium aggregatum]
MDSFAIITNHHKEAQSFRKQFPPSSNQFPTSEQVEQIKQAGLIDAYQLITDPAFLDVSFYSFDQVVFSASDQDRTCISRCPLMPLPGHVYCYFEAEVVMPDDLPLDAAISIGLVANPYPLFRLAGADPSSTSYVRNGEILSNGTFMRRGLPTFTTRTTVGCGYDPELGLVFFTNNGRLVSYFLCPDQRAYHAAVSANQPCVLQVNFGMNPFCYNLKDELMARMVDKPPSYDAAMSQPQ